jgi:hypothetical protein
MTALLEQPLSARPSFGRGKSTTYGVVEDRTSRQSRPVVLAPIADPTLTTEQYNAALAAYLRGAQPIGM